jgi:hypothetical protein
LEPLLSLEPLTSLLRRQALFPSASCLTLSYRHGDASWVGKKYSSPNSLRDGAIAVVCVHG